jgi:antitoxin VapB
MEASSMTEFSQKQAAIQQLLDAHQLDGLLLRQVSSFAWATCGAASYVNSAVSTGVATLLVTRSGRHLITDNIEATRLDKEEKLREQGWEFHVSPWHVGQDELEKLAQGLSLGADFPFPGSTELSAEINRMRSRLTPEEGERFRELGRLCAAGMDRAIRAVRPGRTEFEIAALLAAETQKLGVQPIVNLIATDERIFRFRHPLPTEKTLERYAMLVLCGRRAGLVCSLTRLVHFGRMPDELRRKAEAVATVDAAFIAATRPDRSLAEVFAEGQAAYARTGFANEWELHHQGGSAGYEPREFLGTPTASEQVVLGQAYAWNPSITGTKSEDTVLVGAAENEIISAIPGWPTLNVRSERQEIKRPAILEIA